jgi:hypothetical protein
MTVGKKNKPGRVISRALPLRYFGRVTRPAMAYATVAGFGVDQDEAGRDEAPGRAYAT